MIECSTVGGAKYWMVLGYGVSVWGLIHYIQYITSTPDGEVLSSDRKNIKNLTGLYILAASRFDMTQLVSKVC